MAFRETVAQAFAADGALARCVEAFVPRAGQTAMAEAVAGTMEQGGVLVVEALHAAAALAALDQLLQRELASAGVADRQVFSACFQLDRRLAGLA